MPPGTDRAFRAFDPKRDAADIGAPLVSASESETAAPVAESARLVQRGSSGRGCRYVQFDSGERSRHGRPESPSPPRDTWNPLRPTGPSRQRAVQLLIRCAAVASRGPPLRRSSASIRRAMRWPCADAAHRKSPGLLIESPHPGGGVSVVVGGCRWW
jgi:hypothetical protein